MFGKIQTFSYILNNEDIFLKAMNSKNLIIAGIWAFLIIYLAGFFIVGIKMDFVVYLILFILGFIFSIITTYLPEK